MTRPFPLLPAVAAVICASAATAQEMTPVTDLPAAALAILSQESAPEFTRGWEADLDDDGDADLLTHLRRHNIVGIDMESAGLYGLGMREGLQCLSVMTVSDHLDRDEHMPAAEREQGLARMVTLALESLGDAPAG